MNMFQFLLSITPQLLGAIIAIEHEVNAPGATKKQIVLDSVTIAAKAGEKIPDPHVAGISMLIDSLVGTLNSSGVFNKPAAPPAKTVDTPHAAPQTIVVPGLKPSSAVGTIGGK
jgi:hypothetical protein